ncbi:MAG TPA: chemotaxis protein CheW [Polyangia bacterium]
MADLVLVLAGGRRLGVPAARVREVTQVGSVTPVPTAPGTVIGLTQVRGQILPVLDLDRVREDDPPRAARPGDPLLIVELGPVRAALLCDRVLGVEPEPEGVTLLDVGALFDELRKRVQP